MDTIRFQWGSKSSWGECLTTKSRKPYDNINGNTTLSEAQGVSLRITSDIRDGTRPSTIISDHGGVPQFKGRFQELCTYLCGKALVEKENLGFDLIESDLCPSFVEDLTAKGMGLRVVDSHTVYGGEPSVDLLRAFLNLGPAGNWLTLCNKGHFGIPKALTKPITHLEGWKGNFFFIENKLIPSEYLELLLEDNKLDKKSFKDIIPLQAREDPLYNQIATYPCNVWTFPDPILYLTGLKTSWEHSPKNPIIYHHGREMDLRSFMMEGVDGEFNFIPESGYRQKTQRVPPQESKASGDAFDPLDVDSDPDIHAWRSSATSISALSKARASCDAIREREVAKDKAYAKLERKCNEALLDLEKNLLVLDMYSEIKTLQGQVDKLHSKYSRLIIEENKWVNYEHTLSVLYTKLKSLESKKEQLKSFEVQLLDEMDLLVARLVKAAMFYGRCTTFEEVIDLKEPFVLEKILGYHPSSRKEFDQAGDDLATASYPFITKATVDLYVIVEQLLSKKPRSLHTKPAPSYSKPSSLKAPIN
ncbi:hypothetical protein Tco_0390791 [Tanacetum coccineum]